MYFSDPCEGIWIEKGEAMKPKDLYQLVEGMHMSEFKRVFRKKLSYLL